MKRPERVGDADVIVIDRGDDLANVILIVANVRRLSPIAAELLAPFAEDNVKTVAIVHDEGSTGFVDTEELVREDREPVLLYPKEVEDFLAWAARDWQVRRPVRVVNVVQQSTANAASARSRMNDPMPRRRRGRGRR